MEIKGREWFDEKNKNSSERMGTRISYTSIINQEIDN